MRHARRLSPADVQAAADRAAAGARPPALPVDAVRLMADRAERLARPKPDRQTWRIGIDMAKPGSERTVVWSRGTAPIDDCPF